jgi:hypothetical protein
MLDPNPARAPVRTAPVPDHAELSVTAQWHATQLAALGVHPGLARAAALVGVNWRDVEALTLAGCPANLAIAIASPV